MGGSIPDSGVHEHFAYHQLEGAKNELAECLRCHKYKKAKNTSRQKQHLLEHCPEYKEWLIANDRTSSIRPSGPRSSLVHGGSNASGGRPNKNRSAARSSIGLGIASSSGVGSSIGSGALGNEDLGSGLEDFSVQTNFTSAQKRRIDEKLALAMYASAQPFSMFEDPLWLDFFKELGYVPPPRQTLVEICLMRVRSAARGGAPVRPFHGANGTVNAPSGGAAGATDRMALSSTPSQPQPQTQQGVPLAGPQYSSSCSAHTTPVAAMREPVQTTPVLNNAGPEYNMSEF